MSTIVTYAGQTGLVDGAREKVCTGVVTPGDVLGENGSDQVLRYATAAGNPGAVLVAKEQLFVGRDLNTDYASGDTVQYHNADVGHRMYVRLAASQNIAINGLLEMSATAGKVRALAAGVALFKALEAKVSGGAETPLILVERI